MILDAHCHVWPDALAAKLVAARPAGMDAIGDGTLDGLRGTMDESGVDMACTLAVANEARHVQRTNEFIGAVDRDRFVPVGTVHTGLTVDENIASLRDHGIAAVKFHPNFQNMSLGDPAVHELFAALAAHGIPVLAHVGAGADAAASERGSTRHLATVLRAVPDLVLVAFHFGGYHDIDAAEESAIGLPGLYVETSWPPAVDALGADRIRTLIDKHGADRVVFGSDWPMAHPAREIDTLRATGLSDTELDAILGNTLATLLGVGPKGIS